MLWTCLKTGTCEVLHAKKRFKLQSFVNQFWLSLIYEIYELVAFGIDDLVIFNLIIKDRISNGIPRCIISLSLFVLARLKENKIFLEHKIE